MDVYKPFRVIIFSYDLLRLLFLAVSFALFSIVQAAMRGGIFPYLAYLSSNALFPLIGFFLFLEPLENRNYLPLYMAGKTIAVVLFYIWAVFSLPAETGFINSGNYTEGIVLLGGCFFISLGDVLSVFGIYTMNKKLSRITIPEHGFNKQNGSNGGL